MNSLSRLHIGLTGSMGSGKGEVVHILSQMGFAVTSLSDMVRLEGRKRYGEPTRQQLQDTGNDLRRLGGAGVLGRLVADQIDQEPPGRWLIDGIRNPAEVAQLRRLVPFHLLGIRARREVLIERLLCRKRSDDLADEVELGRRLDREWGIGEPEDGQQVGPTMALADAFIDNDGSLDELAGHLRQFIESIRG
jgi:dephospho-CoA kinase